MLSPEQEYALQLFEEGKNLFITGSGGCGKTAWIKNLINEKNGKTNKSRHLN